MTELEELEESTRESIRAKGDQLRGLIEAGRAVPQDHDQLLDLI